MGRLKASQKWTKRAAFLRRGDVEGAGQDPGLVGHHADRHAAHTGQRGHEVRRPPGPQLQDVAVVDDGPHDVAHVVGGRSRGGDEVAQRRRGAVGGVVGERCGAARRRCGRGGSRAPPRAARPRRPSSAASRAHSPLARACIGRPSEVVQAHPHPGEPLHRVGSRHEGEGVGCHHRDVGQAEQQRGSRDRRSGHRGQDRHRPRAGRHGGRGPAPTVQGVDSLGHLGSRRRQHHDQGEALGQRHACRRRRWCRRRPG